ncbi:hypothetical protein KSP40_PGU015261 [Platanthera guangdongensis]|uniref:30S ribosomal protein 3, chloroplastic n=1 Tax=Platanthera guangdongensis TaxID=2320717 RepID=A0ABR2LL05_9ASPA
MAFSLSLQTTHPPPISRFRSKPFPTFVPPSSTFFPSSSPVRPPLHTRRLRRSGAVAVASDALEDPSPAAHSSDDEKAAVFEPKREKLKVVVKKMEKPRLVLKFIWMEKNIGLGLDQMIPGHGSVPLSPYYFWPRKDAWEELKAKLEEKQWISQKRMIILLNQATDIINLWQQAGGNL